MNPFRDSMVMREHLPENTHPGIDFRDRVEREFTAPVLANLFAGGGNLHLLRAFRPTGGRQGAMAQGIANAAHYSTKEPGTVLHDLLQQLRGLNQ